MSEPSHAFRILPDPKSLANLQRNMARLVAEAGKDPGEAIKQVGWYVGKSAAGATKIAPKRRRVLPNPRFWHPMGMALLGGQYKVDFRLAPWVAERFWGGDEVSFDPIRLPTIDQARASEKARIKRRGLAHDAWFWVVASLGGGIGKVSQPHMAGAYKVDKDLARLNPWVRLTSRLNYAAKAFKTSGRATVDNILSRAANRLEQTVRRKLDGRIKAHS